jgi:hypothetical protein
LHDFYATIGDVQMSKKGLLNENTIRRFMKLASIHPLAENFVDKIKEEEEELEEGGYGMPGARDETAEELPPEEEVPLDPDMEGEEELPELPPEEGEGLEGEGGGLGLSPEAAEEVAEKLASGFAEVVQDALGVEGLLSVEKEGEEDMGMEEPPLEDLPTDPVEEPPMEEPVPEEGEEDLPPLEEAEEEEELSEEDSMMQEKVINELAKRVTEQLLKQSRKKKDKEKYIDSLSEQIVNRIFSSSKKDK